ncbi:hypothetical protein [Staphylococcus hominis]|jgi:hypothetical protein|uniref:hypothetical protein n=1 Tax=Staphylococcus hominis TaxID=1290 RepID=UPI0021A2A51D|nr:hypothetical protein [Staphylococcus hominis]MCT1509027.1 hypothetical protein [Staphylococcus hominis]
MGLFSTKTTEEKLLNELSEEAKKKYFSYTEERKEEILELYKKSPFKAPREIEKEVKKDKKKEEEIKRREEFLENQKIFTEELRKKPLDESLVMRGLDNLTNSTEDLVKRANFPNDWMEISSLATQLANIGNPTNMHMLNMSQTNVSQNFVIIKVLDDIKKNNKHIIEQNNEIIRLLKIISEK